MTTSATLSLGYVAIYVLLVGVASFIEKPAGRGFGAFQLNALIRVGSLAAAAVALIFAHGLAFPLLATSLPGWVLACSPARARCSTASGWATCPSRWWSRCRICTS